MKNIHPYFQCSGDIKRMFWMKKCNCSCHLLLQASLHVFLCLLGLVVLCHSQCTFEELVIKDLNNPPNGEPTLQQQQCSSRSRKLFSALFDRQTNHLILAFRSMGVVCLTSFKTYQNYTYAHSRPISHCPTFFPTAPLNCGFIFSHVGCVDKDGKLHDFGSEWVRDCVECSCTKEGLSCCTK